MSYRSATTRVGLIGRGAELLESELRREGTIPVSRLDDGGDVPPLTTVLVVETFDSDERWRDWELREAMLWDMLETALAKMSNPARMLIIGLTGGDSVRHRKDVRKYLEYLVGEVRVIAVNAYGIDVTVNALEAPMSTDRRLLAATGLRYASRPGIGGNGIVVKLEDLRGMSLGQYLSGFDV